MWLSQNPKINKRGGSNNRVDGIFHQKWINVEVLIRHVVGKFFSKRIRKTPCLLETSEYIVGNYYVETTRVSVNRDK